ncbi:MAG TPA: DUF4893 domain-containing protein [Rhizomicrobium sp.]|nr:DUF4893 domain-containing protein [Rhizomicrobium sp.]
MRKRILEAALVAACVSTAAQAGWQDQASQADAQRLSQLDESRSKGLEAAQSGGDMAAIHEALDGAPASISGDALTGNWHCRSMKLGGMMPSIVYKWFTCRISHRGGGLFLEKLNGTQRTAGFLYPDSNGFVYLGASSETREPPHAYSGNGASVGATLTPDDQIGLFTASSSRAARVEFPYPVQESVFDILELRR